MHNVPIGEFLYSRFVERGAKSVPEGCPKPPSNRTSDAMYEEMKRNAFRYIFTLMDSDEDGFISAERCSVGGLQPEILKLLSPILCEMEETKCE
jgi:hypothetical protein